MYIITIKVPKINENKKKLNRQVCLCTLNNKLDIYLY